MTEYKLYCPKVSDKVLTDCFNVIADTASSTIRGYSITCIGDINLNNIHAEESQKASLDEILEVDSKLIQSASLVVADMTVSFLRGALENLATCDIIKVSTNNSYEPKLSLSQKVNLIATLNKKLKIYKEVESPDTILKDSQNGLLNAQLASIAELESMNTKLTEKISKDLFEKNAELEKKHSEREAALEETIQKRRYQLEMEYQARVEKIKLKKNELDIREKDLDLRDNTAARRDDLRKLIGEIKDRLDKFKLSSETTRLRIPIHIVCWIVIGLSTLAAFVYGREFLSLLEKEHLAPNSYVLLQLGIKQLAFMAIAGSTVVFYLKWLNSWFGKNAQAEFHLKQLHLDFERANWVVESVLEWNGAQEGKEIPGRLLDSITNNLFEKQSEDFSQVVHPSEQLLGILGSIERVELSGKGIKKAVKSAEKQPAGTS